MTGPGLRATTVVLPEPPDLLGFAGDRGWLFRGEHGGVAGQGVALRIDLPEGLGDPAASARVADALAAIPADDPIGHPGTGPVAIGALPFDPTASGHLIVPRRMVGRRGDTGWVTTVEPAGSAWPADPEPAP
ncbi:MAG TPA: hypothetical protein VFN68_16920, partial [Acidimicrobiales bacterium]|nr:hypothetical protein [Acidimicrobiales bacterium]